MIITLTVNTVGGAGSAVGATTSTLPVTGWLEAVKIVYNGSAPASTDLNLNEIGGLGRTLLTITNSNTPVTLYPEVYVSNPTATVLTTLTKPYFIDLARLQVGIAGCDPLTAAAVVTIQIREGGTS